MDKDHWVCVLAAKNPQNYILPHPDCSKFHVCQFLGGTRHSAKSWKAHIFDCPATTGFDELLKVCNHLHNLKQQNGRCGKCNRNYFKKRINIVLKNLSIVINIRFYNWCLIILLESKPVTNVPSTPKPSKPVIRIPSSPKPTEPVGEKNYDVIFYMQLRAKRWKNSNQSKLIIKPSCWLLMEGMDQWRVFYNMWSRGKKRHPFKSQSWG